jgi:HEAT repeat protein
MAPPLSQRHAILMIELLFYLTMALRRAALSAATTYSRPRRRRTWFGLASRLHLVDVAPARALKAGCVLRGTRDGLEVRILDKGGDTQSTTLEIDGRGAIPPMIELRPALGRPSSAMRAQQPDGRIGDPVFDDIVSVRGPWPTLLALLDPHARALIGAFTLRGGSVAKGIVRMAAKRILGPDDEADVALTVSYLSTAFEVVTALCQPLDCVGRLCERFRQEPVPLVRQHLIELLANMLEDDDRPRQVLREALNFDDQELRLHAAIALGDEGRDALLDIAWHPEGDNRQAQQAIEALRRRLPLAQALSMLGTSLALGRHNVACAIIQALGRIGGETAIERLADLLMADDGDLAAAAARALAATEDVTAEPALMKALSHGRPAVRAAAAEALGFVGTSTAVPALHTLIEVAGSDRSLTRAARQAIAAIQARIPGASPGQVSLAEGEAGRLALANESDSGRLSIADK